MVRGITSLCCAILVTMAFCVLAPLMSSTSTRDLPELISPVQLVPLAQALKKPQQRKIEQKKILELPKTPKRQPPQKEPLQQVKIPLQPLHIQLAPNMTAHMPVAPQKVSTPQKASFEGVGVYDLANVDMAPKLKRYMPPLYPPKAKGQRIEGKVVVRCVVTAGGRVESAEVISAEPSGYFESAALKSVKKWTFIPAKYQGEKVAVYVDIPLTFSLD